MPIETTDIIYIGSLSISRPFLDVLSPLVGTIVGGLITYFVTRSIDSQKWRQDKMDKLACTKREGLIVALKWIDPIQNSISKAGIKVFAFAQGEIDTEQLDWPNLMSNLAKLDVPYQIKVLLPDDIYLSGFKIISGLEELQRLVIKFNHEIRAKRPATSFDECRNKLNELEKLSKELIERIIDEYKKTYN